MTKKFVILMITACFLLQSATLFAKDNNESIIPKKVAKLLEKGDKALNGNKLPEALDFYNKALAEDPKVPETYLKLSNLALKQNNAEEAVKNLESAYQLDQNNKKTINVMATTLYNLAHEQLKNQNFDKAGEYFSQLLKINNLADLEKKMYVDAYFKFGYCLFIGKKFPEAEKAFQSLLQIPNLPAEFSKTKSDSQYMLGAIYNQQKEYNKSNEFLEKYMEMNKDQTDDPLLPRVNLLLGTNYYELLFDDIQKIKEEKEEPQPPVKKTAKGKKSEPPAQQKPSKHERIAETALKVNQIETYLKKVQSIPEYEEDVTMKLGNYYYLCQKYDLAKTCYQTLIEKFATSPDIETYKKFLGTIEKEMSEKKGS